MRAVLSAVDALTPEFKRIFRLRFCEECTYKEIAVTMAISEPLARKRVQHLRQHLREAVGEERAAGKVGHGVSQAVQ